ncbi:NUDIX hydrolase [Kitasatospora sp. NPDC056800]|uniref:NUDIX hydrolase n=1 Tax=Kitasatospora sp. NPDC056800 TaxID=3345948 RepID=UPI00369A8717
MNSGGRNGCGDGAADSSPAALHSVSVAGVVVREDGRVLAIRRADNGTWEPPGGVLELAETVEDGLCREIREETGIEVGVDQLTGVYKNMVRGVVALVFRCHPTGGAERLSSESTAIAWLAPDEVADRMAEVYAVRVLDALHPGPARVRSHDGRHLTAAPERLA